MTHQSSLLTTIRIGINGEQVSNPIELARRLADLPQTLVSHHLKSLRENGLVTVTAHGRSNVYSPCCAAVADPLELLAGLTKDPTTHLMTGA